MAERILHASHSKKAYCSILAIWMTIGEDSPQCIRLPPNVIIKCIKCFVFPTWHKRPNHKKAISVTRYNGIQRPQWNSPYSSGNGKLTSCSRYTVSTLCNYSFFTQSEQSKEASQSHVNWCISTDRVENKRTDPIKYCTKSKESQEQHQE